MFAFTLGGRKVTEEMDILFRAHIVLMEGQEPTIMSFEQVTFFKWVLVSFI